MRDREQRVERPRRQPALASSTTQAVLLVGMVLHVPLFDAAVVGLTADLEMWPQDSKYLNITATAGATVRRSEMGLRYSVAADITLVYETTRWNGSMVTETPPRPYYQAIMDQVDEILLMDYGQTTLGGLCQVGSQNCNLAKPLWWTAPWIVYAESLRRISDGRRQVLVTMGLPVGANLQGTTRGWFSTETQLERFIDATTEWAITSGFTTSGNASRATGWQRGPFHKESIFQAELYLNITKTAPCPVAVCPPGAKRQPRGLWVYQNTADPMIYAPASEALHATADFLQWCGKHGVDELYLFPARIRGCPIGSNATTEEALARFVRAADRAGVSVQLFVGVNKLWADSLTRCVEEALNFVRREHLQPPKVMMDAR
eukprot:COSAG02_NODE_4241_length_5596_cov_4.207932_1_plen_375_part_00